MRNDRRPLTTPRRLMRSAFVALAFASAVAAAQAQTQKTTPPAPAEPSAAAPANPDAVPGVTVDAARRPLDARIPADKLADYNAQAARDQAFRDYRQTTPPVKADAKGVANPNDESKNFPGLQAYVPQQ